MVAILQGIGIGIILCIAGLVSLSSSNKSQTNIPHPKNIDEFLNSFSDN